MAENLLEFQWTIPNHPDVIKSATSLTGATREFSYKYRIHQETQKCQVGYKMVDDKKFTVFLRRLGPNSECDQHLVKCCLWYKDKGTGEWQTRSRYQMEAPVLLLPNQELTLPKFMYPLGESFLVDSQNTMWWKLQVLVTEPMEEFQLASASSTKKNWAALLGDPSSADLKIVCSDDVEVTAHKLILSALNPVFASMLTADMSEKNTGIVNVTDVSSPIMDILLHFIYTGDLLEEWDKPDNIVEITYAAGKYQLTNLLELLDNTLGKEEYAEVNYKLLGLAGKLSLKKAENRLLEIIKQLVIKTTNGEQLGKLIEKFLA